MLCNCKKIRFHNWLRIAPPAVTFLTLPGVYSLK